MNEVIDYLQKKGIAFRPEGKEVVIKCPVCDKNKLSINTESQVFQCFYCKAKNPSAFTVRGHLSKLKEFWGDIVPVAPITNPASEAKKKAIDFTDMADRYHYELLNNNKAKKYLIKRGFTLADIKRFKFGFVRHHKQDWISIPSIVHNVVKLIKYRKLLPDETPDMGKYTREPGGESVMWNEDALEKYDDIIVAEGEFDGSTLVKYEYDNTVGATVGAGTLDTAWYDKLVLKNKIYLVMDSDSPGQIAAREVWATRLGVDKCYNVTLPEGEDVNSYFKSHTKDDFDLLLEKAERFTVKGVSSVSDALYSLYEQVEFGDSLTVWPLPWPSINGIIGGGLSRRRLLVLGGQSASGKTSMAMQIAYHFATVHKLPVFIFCLEMPETDLALKVIQLRKDLTLNEINPHDALVYATEVEGIPIYFGYSSSITSEIFYNTMKEVRNRYGVALGVFDNLQLLVRSDKESDIGIASRSFKNLVMDLNVMLILISQPRKLNSENTPTMDSLKGSVTIGQDADYVLLIHRKRLKGMGEGAFDSYTYVINDKARLAAGGTRKLNFIGEKSRFEEITT